MTRALLDACVLYPAVMREVLVSAAKRGLYRPLWSARLLEEWARAAAKRGAGEEAIARGDVALLRAAFPAAEVPPAPGIEQRLWLPDPADVHVLAVAIASGADLVVTMNAKDFPRHTLREEGLDRIDPDAFLMDLWLKDAAGMEAAVADVVHRAARMDDAPRDARTLLKKARLPRLAKAIG
nr:PIN domain-containing protein [Tropicimonas sp. IMCC34011]